MMCCGKDLALALVLGQLFHRTEQVVRLRQDGILENRLVGHECVGRSYAADRRIEMIEELIGNASRDLRAVAPTQRVFVGHEGTVRSSH